MLKKILLLLLLLLALAVFVLSFLKVPAPKTEVIKEIEIVNIPDKASL